MFSVSWCNFASDALSGPSEQIFCAVTTEAPLDDLLDGALPSNLHSPTKKDIYEN